MNESSAVAEAVALLPEEREAQWMGLANRMRRCVNSAEENLGNMEEELLRGSHELMRQMLEKAAQAKAAAAAPRCPECQQPLRCLSGGHRTTIQTRFGSIRVERVRGKCRRCRRWRFPADAVLGLPGEGTQSPAVQEIAALTVSKMPASEAEQVVERLVGIKISAATLGRQARQQGERAQEKRRTLDGQMSGPEGRVQQDRDLQMQLPLEPFTLAVRRT